MEYPKRKPNRLKEYDYGAGAYFITICTHGRKCILSDIIVGEGLAPPVVRLTQYGAIAEEQLLALERRYPTVQIDQYVIMPNHIHAILQIREQTGEAGGASPSPTLVDAVGAFKSLTTRLCNRIQPIPKLFQRSFHDHVIRNETDYKEIRAYIENNPAKWAEDTLYTKEAMP